MNLAVHSLSKQNILKILIVNNEKKIIHKVNHSTNLKRLYNIHTYFM